MNSHLGNIIFKEMKEIFRDPRLFLSMVIVPLLIFPIMGAAFGGAMTSTVEQLEKLDYTLVVYDQDEGNESELLIAFLNSTDKLNVTLMEPPYTIDDAIDHAVANELDVVVEIPANFSSNLENGTRADIIAHSIMETVSIIEGEKDNYPLSLLWSYETYLVERNVAGTNTTYNSSFFLDPIGLSRFTVLQGEKIPYSTDQVIGFFIGQSTMIPIILMMLIIMSAQLAAVTIASEKEEKTLETLLTLPVNRTTILMGKISGVAIMAMFGAVAYMGGFIYYMNTMTGMTGNSLGAADMGLTLNWGSVAVLGISVVLALLAAFSLAVLMAAFTEDVRSAQSLTGIIVIPVAIPAFVLMIADINTLPGTIQGVLYALPFSYPMLASKGLFTGVGMNVILGLVYQLIFTLVMFGIAGKLFSTEKIFTSKLELKRKR